MLSRMPVLRKDVPVKTDDMRPSHRVWMRDVTFFRTAFFV